MSHNISYLAPLACALLISPVTGEELAPISVTGSIIQDKQLYKPLSTETDAAPPHGSDTRRGPCTVTARLAGKLIIAAALAQE